MRLRQKCRSNGVRASDKYPLANAYQKGFQKHPVGNAFLILAVYWVMDSQLLNVFEDIGSWPAVLGISMTLMIFYLYYVLGYILGYQGEGDGHDVPQSIKNRKKYVMGMFSVLIILTIAIPLGYDKIITKWLPAIDTVYYPSQVLLLVCIAPIMEELVFRYFLYDRWARIKYGTVKGILATGFIFVICHPVSDLNSIILYWVPTLLFYLIYDSFGLYGSITAHILFNLIAL